MSGKVLIIAPHADDEILGAGGTIAKHIENGDEVSVVIIADRKNLALEQRIQAQEAQKILGYQNLHFLGLRDERLDGYAVDIIKPLEGVYEKIKPKTVYIPHKGDYNLDHRAVFKASMVACRIFQKHPPNKILSYEAPSSTNQGLMEPFTPNSYNTLSHEQLTLKIDAFNVYDAEQRGLPNPRNEDGIANIAINRGMDCGESFAEAFVMLRETS